MGLYMYMYVCMYIYVCVCLCMHVYICVRVCIYIYIYQRREMNKSDNQLKTIQTANTCAQISLSTPLTMPCAIHILWKKQQAGKIHVCKNKINRWIFKKYKALRGPTHFNIYNNKYMYKVSKVGYCRWGQPEGSLFSSYYTEV